MGAPLVSSVLGIETSRSIGTALLRAQSTGWFLAQIGANHDPVGPACLSDLLLVYESGLVCVST